MLRYIVLALILCTAVPVVVGTDLVVSEAYAASTITVYVHNPGSFDRDLVIKDDNTGRIVFDGRLSPGETSSIRITASSSGYGTIRYRRKQGSSWTIDAWLKHGETITPN